MENNFNEDNFESFLQNQLQNHRMYPKDAVWREINIKLHGEKRWPALTFASFLLISITTFICLHFSSKQNIFTTKPVLIPLISDKTVAYNQKTPLQKFNTFSFKKIDASTNSEVENEQITNNAHNLVAVNNRSALVNQFNDVIKIDEYKIATNYRNTTPTLQNVSEGNVSLNNLSSNKELELLASDNVKPTNLTTEGLPLQIIGNTNTQNTVSVVESGKSADEKIGSSLIDDYKASKKPGKFSLLVYFAPSISYRKLVEDQSIIKGINNGPVGVNQVADVNDVVRHKPSKGLEGGLSLMYDLNKKIKIKSGFQFNVRQYAIDAFRSNTEISSIALVDNNQINTLNTLVYYRNYNGNSSTELINRYYQISLPLGVEWEVFGNKKVQFNVAGSIQPTYILNRSAYLLTTNFKNYTENNDLVRQWNINSNFEAFVSLVVGDVKWQLGPQIRFQPNSTFISQYPINEYLIDYGIKLGISTNLK